MGRRTSTRRSNTKRHQPKSGNLPLAKAMQELRRSSAAEPHRNRARYSRADERRARQRGEW